jgi:hypothetical protein
VRVAPRSAAASLGGVRGEAVVVRVTAAPVGGAANEAVVALLARLLDLPRSQVRIERGARSRDKVVSLPVPAATRLRELAARRENLGETPRRA